jgi:hypothetical protein
VKLCKTTSFPVVSSLYKMEKGEACVRQCYSY